jgi:site-specific recombinase XerD
LSLSALTAVENSPELPKSIVASKLVLQIGTFVVRNSNIRSNCCIQESQRKTINNKQSITVMINRKNKKLVDEYLASRKDEVSPLSISLAETHLRLLLEFADETYFLDLPKRKQTFAQYIKSPEARRDGKEEKLSHEYSRKVISDAKHFFEWLRDEKEHTEITARFLKSFRISKENRDDEDQELYALDELLKIIATPCFTTLDERTQASCVFLFLSGMRISAFLTMPVKAFDLEARTVKQWPSLGMHTKLGI